MWFVKERRIWLASQFESRGINWRTTSTNTVMENDLKDERFPECGFHRLKRRKKRIMKIIIFLQTNRALFYTAFPPIFVGKRDRNKSKLSFNSRLYSQGVHVFFFNNCTFDELFPSQLAVMCVFSSVDSILNRHKNHWDNEIIKKWILMVSNVDKFLLSFLDHGKSQ